MARNAGFADFQAYTFRRSAGSTTPRTTARGFTRRWSGTWCRRSSGSTAAGGSGSVSTRLRPWDLDVDPHGRAATPLRSARSAELIARHPHDVPRGLPALGAEFDTMIREGLLDLGTRKGKAPGGYCETLHYRGRPFIFMNAVGVPTTSTPCSTRRGTPSTPSRRTGSRSSGSGTSGARDLRTGLDVDGTPGGAATSAGPRRVLRRRGARPGPDRAPRGRARHPGARGLGGRLPELDLHQRRGRRPGARDRAWLRIRAAASNAGWTGRDWSGSGSTRWYRQLHIFLYPFYYIEYGIAQLGALQVWRNSLRDRADAVRAATARRWRSGARGRCRRSIAAAGARFVVRSGR